MATPSATAELASAPPHSAQVLRVGLEYLPPDERFATVESTRTDPRGEPTRAANNPPTTRPQRGGEEPPSRVPRLSRIDFAAIDDPVARETLHFLADLVETDRLRAQREVGIPFLDFRRDDSERTILLRSEERNLEDHEQWVQQNGPSLLRRPMRKLLKRLPLVHDLEVQLEDFRSDHMPLSQPYQKVHGDRRRLGRLSLRVHASDLQDPVEVVYINRGVRIGTSQEHAKATIEFELDPSLRLAFRARNEYDTGDVTFRGDLIYGPNPRVSVHLSAGDNMDFLSTSSIYSLFESPMDGKPGLVLYAVHTF